MRRIWFAAAIAAAVVVPTTSAGAAVTCSQPYAPWWSGFVGESSPAAPQLPGATDVTYRPPPLDMDGDGTEDAVHADDFDNSRPQQLHVSRGDGELVLHGAPGVLLLSSPAGDLDRDGRSELYVEEKDYTEGHTADAWQVIVPGTTAVGSADLHAVGIRVSVIAITLSADGSMSPAQGDQDGDGRVDLSSPAASGIGLLSGRDVMAAGPGGDARPAEPFRDVASPTGLVQFGPGRPIYVSGGPASSTRELTLETARPVRLASDVDLINDAPRVRGYLYRGQRFLIYRNSRRDGTQLVYWNLDDPCAKWIAPGLEYAVADAAGHLTLFGTQVVLTPDVPPTLRRPIVDVAMTRDRRGGWMVAADGGVFTFGSASFFGSAGNLRLSASIVGIEPTASGHGYWLLGADGGVFSFGDAPFLGSRPWGGTDRASVAIARAGSRGYWVIRSDGAVAPYGDASSYVGPASVIRALRRPIVSAESTRDGAGLWLVAADGGVFTFGTAGFHGSAASLRLAAPIVGIASTPDDQGYWLVGRDGGIFTFGNATYGGRAPNATAITAN